MNPDKRQLNCAHSPPLHSTVPLAGTQAAGTSGPSMVETTRTAASSAGKALNAPRKPNPLKRCLTASFVAAGLTLARCCQRRTNFDRQVPASRARGGVRTIHCADGKDDSQTIAKSVTYECGETKGDAYKTYKITTAHVSAVSTRLSACWQRLGDETVEGRSVVEVQMMPSTFSNLQLRVDTVGPQVLHDRWDGCAKQRNANV